MPLVGSVSELRMHVDPVVAEAAVWRVISGSGEGGPELLSTHARRTDRIYELADATARSGAFARLAVAEFDELRLAEPLRRAIAERPALASSVRSILVGQARSAHDEGVTCEPKGEHLGFRIEIWRFADPDGLLTWARHALGHAEDTIDPAFRFEPGWDGDGSGASIRSAAQGRLHRLWDVTVDGRSAARGLRGSVSRGRHRERLAADLPGAPDAAVDIAFSRLWDGPRPDFPTLLNWATRPADLVAELVPEELAPPRADRCPLCRFPSDDVVAPEAAIAERVVAEYPDWRPEQGLCARCTDRYRLTGRLGGAR